MRWTPASWEHSLGGALGMTGESEEVSDERECFTWCRMVIGPAQMGQDGFISDLFRWVEASLVITKAPFVSQFFFILATSTKFSPSWYSITFSRFLWPPSPYWGIHDPLSCSTSLCFQPSPPPVGVWHTCQMRWSLPGLCCFCCLELVGPTSGFFCALLKCNFFLPSPLLLPPHASSLTPKLCWGVMYSDNWNTLVTYYMPGCSKSFACVTLF